VPRSGVYSVWCAQSDWVRYGHGIARCVYAHRHRVTQATPNDPGCVRRTVLDITPLPDGYAYRFEPTSEILSHLARLVDLERQCCAFLTFRITDEAGRQPTCLEMTGPPEAKAVIADYFGS
jgi:hypothetical protein